MKAFVRTVVDAGAIVDRVGDAVGIGRLDPFSDQRPEHEKQQGSLPCLFSMIARMPDHLESSC